MEKLQELMRAAYSNEKDMKQRVAEVVDTYTPEEKKQPIAV